MTSIKRNLFYDKDELSRNLRLARLNIYYKDYVKRSFRSTIISTLLIHVLIFFVLSSVAETTESNAIFTLLIFSLPITYYVLFNFFLKIPEVRIIRSKKNIEAEITSAIRFLVLDMKANASVFDALENLSKNFDEIGQYLEDIVIKVKLGSSLEETLNEAVEQVPSEAFRVFLWQIINHLQTGVDITHTLAVIVNEIVENQRIEFKKYGKKLNVLSLFYMIVAIILPTIGFTLISAALIFLSVPITVGLIVGFWIIFTVLQLVFLALSSGNRPVVES